MSTSLVVIRPASPSDMDSLEVLLVTAGLPVAGVRDPGASFVVAEAEHRLAGAAGLEVHGRDGLLRSVAVDASHRNRGLGTLLTERVIKEAREKALRRLYLLTTTAAEYFPRHGFRRISRDEASPAVKQSIEFREACPDTAVVMMLELEPEPAAERL